MSKAKTTRVRQMMVGSMSALSIAALLAACGSTSSSATASKTSATSGASTGSSASQASTSGGSKSVTIGYVNWTEDVATTHLWQDILQNKGYKVTLKSFSDPGPLFTGLAEGGLNVFFDTWMPITHKQYIDKFGAKLTDLGKWYQGQTKEGFVVPQYVYNSGIKTIADLKANASKFGNQIVGIDPGAGEMGLAKKAMQQYGLTNLKLVGSSSAAMLSQLASDYKLKKPVVVTLWSPHWAFTKYKLDYLSDPKKVFGTGGWIQTEANTKWVQGGSKVVGWLKNFKLTPSQLGHLEEDINNASSTNAGVKKWMAANQSLINSWTS